MGEVRTGMEKWMKEFAADSWIKEKLDRCLPRQSR